MFSLYISLLNTAIHWTLTYRFTFLLNRLRNILSLIFTYFLWKTAYAQHSVLFGYTYEEMIAYLLIAAILSSFLNFGYTADIAGEILSGQVINYVLKPHNYISFAFLKELGQKSVNLFFVCLEVAVFIMIVRPSITVHATPLSTLIFIFFFCLSIILTFNISFIISLSSFWNPEVWGPRFIYTVFTSIVAGTMFPLDVLPKSLYQFLLLTPLPYLFFIPAKLLLKPIPELAFAFTMCALWTLVSFLVLQYLWKKGSKEYNFYGR